MKKLNILTLGVGLVFGLSACNPSAKTEDVKTEKAKVAKVSGIDLSAINKNIRPQDDLFRHVNGAWLNATEIPADKSGYGVVNIMYDETQQNLKKLIQEAASSKAKSGSNTQKLGDMYNSYMNIELVNQKGLSPLSDQLKSIANIENMQQVSEKFGELLVLGVGGTFNFYVYPDAKNPEIVTLYLYQSGLTLPDRDYYTKEEEKFVNFRAATQKYMADLLAKSKHSGSEQAAIKLMALETDIATKHISNVESRDAEKNYNKQSVSHLQTLLGSFDWQAYAKASGIGHINELVIRNTPYFENISELFKFHDLQTWKDYLTYKLLDTYAPRLDQSLVDLHFDFHSTTLNGIPEQKPRWKNAVSATSSVLGEVLGQQYVERHFPPQAKAKMDTLVKNLTKAYAQSIEELDWMTAETKTAALEKLALFTAKIGYPEKWRDYSSLEIIEDDLVGNYLRYAAFNHAQEVKKIGLPVDKTEWSMTPQTINAYYSPVRNEIVFPAGILQYPFFNLHAEDAVNYGAIGYVIGHEIGHGFDDQGSKYDGLGNLVSWWTDKDREAFDALGSKLVAQFDKYHPIEGQNINGELTLGENIGDLAGLTIGYKAYQLSLAGKKSAVIDGLTGAQRYFMGFAQILRGKYREDTVRARLLSDPHSPNEFRINGIAKNVDAFYQAFDVKEGDAMYLKPEDRVNIW